MKYLRRGAIALLLMIAGPGSTSAQPAPTEETSAHLAAATAIQAQTRARLGVLGDAFTCADARLVSFRRSDAEPETVEQWYVASQLWADAVLLEATPAAERQADFLLNLREAAVWDDTFGGGLWWRPHA